MIAQEFLLQRYAKNGEKTGWTFIEFEPQMIEKLGTNSKTSFRVKGHLDSLPIKQLAVMPIGEGYFILPLKAEIRKKIGKEEGQKVQALLELDDSKLELSEDFLACLEDEPKAMAFFDTLSPGHQRYFSNWIESAKTIETKTKRISQSLYGLANHMDYGQMIRHFKSLKNK
ncbi:YdeI/OmpD-associated family protein [Marinilongibacter aquaticus]|uniref:YdeI/OmpD-associated family protein n=1 Tax=Marinilongibacter aquaticus TaxID=2975157 RepID=UPI0021BD659F|nr:YdeI/OmpD-associated family protein [Marinilongibacter aquaticus]UBM57397.1 YdeI/OmpD-associated family protein [Marinilongibacter aquaticus]